MRIGVIDLGTNSVRFDIYETFRPGFIRSVYREKQMVRLGEGSFKKSELLPSAMNRTFAALSEFQQRLKREGVDHVSGCATSAVRDAKNGRLFIKKIQSKLGLAIEVISGREEARLILEGITAFEPEAGSTFAFIDIGGGSTEIGVRSRSKTVFVESFELGAARLRQKLLTESPAPEEIRHLRAHIRDVLAERPKPSPWPKLKSAFGSSGTIKALSKIMKSSDLGVGIERSALADLVAQMSKFHQNDLMLIPGMELKRVDIILSGAILLEELMDYLGAREVVRTRFALREGLLQDYLMKLGVARRRNELIL